MQRFISDKGNIQKKSSFNIQILFRIITFIFLALFSGCSGQSETKYEAKMSGIMFYNQTELPFVSDTRYLFDNFLFEKIYTKIERNFFNRTINGKIVPDLNSPNSTTDSLTKYILTDLKSLKCIEFSLSDTPIIIKTYTIAEKKDGFLFKTDLPEIEKDLQKLHITKDTIINGGKYALLEDTSLVMINNFRRKKMKVYVNLELSHFPIHLISTILDNKYKGLTMRYEFYDTSNNTFGLDWTVITKLSNKERLQIVKYINIYQESCK